MKTLFKSSSLIAVVISMSVLLTSAVPDCPPYSDGWTIYLPNPDDCNSFYECSNGEAILQYCPPDLHFNAQLDCCDWPQSAGCDGSGDDYDKYLKCTSAGGVYDQEYRLVFTDTKMVIVEGKVCTECCETYDCDFRQGACCTGQRTTKCEIWK